VIETPTLWPNSRRFLYRNKTINMSTQMPDSFYKSRILAISVEAVTCGGTCITARGLRERNGSAQRVVRAGYTGWRCSMSNGKACIGIPRFFVFYASP
jgi:hypothetical protein